MYQLKINYKKNALLTVLGGRIEEKEAKTVLKKFSEGVDKLKPGFTVITDITAFVPTSEEVRNTLRDATRYAVRKGMGRSIRIVADSLTSSIGNLQFERTSQTIGSKTEIVKSMAEARQLLGW